MSLDHTERPAWIAYITSDLFKPHPLHGLHLWFSSLESGGSFKDDQSWGPTPEDYASIGLK